MRPRVSVSAVLRAVLVLALWLVPGLTHATGEVAPLTFDRDDASDFHGFHELSLNSAGTAAAAVPSLDWCTFNIHIRTGEHIDGSWYVNHVWVDFNGDGNWEGGTESEAYLTWTFAPPANGVSETHVIQVKYQFGSSLGGATPPWTRTISVPVTILPPPRAYKDSRGDIMVQVKNEDCANKVPILLVEGIDTENTTFPTEVYDRAQSLGATLANSGYEVFILNWADGGAALDYNAKALQGALTSIRQICPNHDIALVGFSMGGVIARYALAEDEQLGIPHHVALFVSFDSPQQLAHANRGLEDFIHSNDNRAAIAKLAHVLKSPAAKQMLDYNPYDVSHGISDAFFGTLNTLNGDGYPHQSYNVAISDGAVDASGIYKASYGWEHAGEDLAEFHVYVGPIDYLSYHLPAEQIDVGAGSTYPNFKTATLGSLFPYFTVYFTEQIYFDPVYMPTWSTLDLQGPAFNSHGDIVNHPPSRFDDVLAQTTTRSHVEMTPEIQAKLLQWLQLRFCSTAFAPDLVSLQTPVDYEDLSSQRWVVLKWVPGCNARWFDVQVATDAAFTQMVYAGQVTGPQLDLGVSLRNGAYYWRVRAGNATGAGPWTVARVFSWRPPIVVIAGKTALSNTDARQWSVTASSGYPPYAYQWRTKGVDTPPVFYNWYDVPNGNGTSVSGVWLDTRMLPFWLECDVSDAYGNHTHQDQCISSVTEPAIPTVALAGPSSVAYGATGTWTVSAQYGRACGQYSYAWRWRMANTSTWSDVIGTSSTLTTGLLAVGSLDLQVEVKGEQTGTAVMPVTMLGPSDGCPTVDARVAGGWREENTVLARSLSGSLTHDTYKLKAAPDVTNGFVEIRIRENEQERTTLDAVRLVAVDHPSNVEAFAVGNRVVLGRHLAPARVRNASGVDLTAALAGPGAQGYAGHAGDTLYVDLSAPARAGAGVMTPREIIVDDGDGGGGKGGVPGPFTSGARPSSAHEIDEAIVNRTGLLFQCPDGAGGWTTVAHRYPRANIDVGCVDGISTTAMRIVFLTDERLWYVGPIEVVESDVAGISLPLERAVHSRLGDVTQRVSADGGVSTTVVPNDTVNVRFGWAPLADGQVRDLFLISNGVYTADVSSDLAGTATPVVFALRQNVPNPFRNTTAIRFDLPQATSVVVDIFDAQGRKVRSLSKRTFEAGQQSVTWDHRDDSGNQVSAGVYFCRVEAGAHVARQRMVLLP